MSCENYKNIVHEASALVLNVRFSVFLKMYANDQNFELSLYSTCVLDSSEFLTFVLFNIGLI
jgi:hypothetical protein